MTRENIKQYLLQIKQKEGEEVLSNRWKPDILVEIIDQIYDEHEAQLKAKDEEIERLSGLIKSLWQIIDDIDTYGDMAKSNDALFRSLVEKKQKERWKLPITTDGYEIMLKDKA